MMTPTEIDNLQSTLLQAGWLKRVQWQRVVDSTNTWARQSSGEMLPALYWADQQTHGRGRGDHLWWSPAGCLMMTLAISSTELPADPSAWNQLSLLVGLASAEAIERVCPESDIHLKWPNDLYVDTFKIGGILIETLPNRRDGETVPTGHEQVSLHDTIFLIGIGINVQVDWSDAPDGMGQHATCLSSRQGTNVDRLELLAELTDSIRQRLSHWKAEGFRWHEDWRSRCLLTGKVVEVANSRNGRDSDSNRWMGRCEGISQEGHLLVRSESGEVRSVGFGEVLLKR